MGTRLCCGDRCCDPIYPLGKLFLSRSRGVNASVCVNNGLPAALPHASPRLKIPMAPHWCCRVAPPGRVPGGSVSWENSCSREIGSKIAGGGVLLKSKMKIEVRNEDWHPPGCLSQRLKMGTRLCCVVTPFTPWENSYSRDLGG